MIPSKQTTMKVTLIILQKNHKPEKMKRKETTGISMPSNRNISPIWLDTDPIKKKMTKMVQEL